MRVRMFIHSFLNELPAHHVEFIFCKTHMQAHTIQRQFRNYEISICTSIRLLVGEIMFTNQEVSYLDIPVKYKDGDGNTVVISEPWPIIDVHESMSFLVGAGKILVPHSERLKYWRSSKAHGEPWAQNVESELMVPIGLYGDSAKMTTKFGSENVLAMFCNVLLWRPSSVRWSRFLIFCISEERLTTQALQAFLRRIAWSCNHAHCGRFPEAGVHGEALSGAAARKAGLPLTSRLDRFQVTEYRGDWSWHKKIWRFWKTQWNAEYVCHLCNAKGISENWQEVYWNIESNNHREFSVTSFIANRIPPRVVCYLECKFTPSIKSVNKSIMHACES